MASRRKSVLITGCSTGGIGAGLAQAFHQKGYHVFVTLRNLSKAPSSLSASPHVTLLKLDVLSPEAIVAAVSSVTKETGGRLDVLVNNSGQNFIMPALDTAIDDARKLFDLNFFAPLAMLQAFAPLLIKARGCVINQSSAAGHMAMPFLSSFYYPLLLHLNVVPFTNRTFSHCTGMYNSSKAAMIMASDIWRRELEPLGIRTITLITTSVKTPAFDNVQMPRIPKTSHYYVIHDYIYRLGDGRLQDGGLDPLIYGLTVVEELEKGKSGNIWVGKDAGMSHWAWKLLPTSLFVS